MQIELLKCVAYNWLRGHPTNAQSNYFQDAHHRTVHRIHFWHKSGLVLAIAGLFLGSLYVVQALVAVFEGDLLGAFSVWSWRRGLCWLILIPLACGLVYYLMSRSVQHNWEELRLRYLDRMLDIVVCTREAQQFAHAPTLFRREMLRNFWCYAAPAAVVAAFALLLGVLFQHVSVLLPDVKEWVIILSAWLLIFGALSIAWPERNLYSELAYQYGTMQALFEIAANRIEPMIAELERLHRLSTDRCAAEHEVCLRRSRCEEKSDQEDLDRAQEVDKLQQHAHSEYPRLLREIQLALFTLGTESFDENAEWLILHRARPLEPVMAG